MKIIAIVLIIVGIILFFVRRNQSQLGYSLKLARATTIDELENTAQAIATEIGGGSWRDYVKIWGKITTSEPILSEIKQEPCVYFTLSVTREYEARVREQNEEGKWEEKTQRKSETVASHRRSIPFFLEDKTGVIEVNPEEAQIDTVKILDEFRPGEARGGMVSWGNFSLILNSHISSSENKTLGYHYRESILPVGREVLVVGEVSDETGSLKIGKPISREKKLLISLKSNEALAASIARNERNIFYAMIGCLLIGLCLLAIGLL